MSMAYGMNDTCHMHRHPASVLDALAATKFEIRCIAFPCEALPILVSLSTALAQVFYSKAVDHDQHLPACSRASLAFIARPAMAVKYRPQMHTCTAV
jgi:hypothetical protein